MPDGTAQCAVLPHRLAKFEGHLRQQALLRQVAACFGDLLAQHRRVGEMLEEGHQVGNGFVQRQHVDIRWLHKARVQAIHQRMGGLVSDNIVREAGERRAARQRQAGGDMRGGKVAEEERFLLWAVIRISLAQGMWVDSQVVDKLAVLLLGISAIRGPEQPASQRLFEVEDGGAGNGINHLLVELRIALGGRQAVLGK
ncbi:MAG: hypothetical protein BWY76_00161 [bacterium ADurb.Bin429]|nr:MAG: hypothetical protein BWY76_00161 [bacterium ADurb.Bin429]